MRMRMRINIKVDTTELTTATIKHVCMYVWGYSAVEVGIERQWGQQYPGIYLECIDSGESSDLLCPYLL